MLLPSSGVDVEAGATSGGGLGGGEGLSHARRILVASTDEGSFRGIQRKHHVGVNPHTPSSKSSAVAGVSLLLV